MRTLGNKAKKIYNPKRFGFIFLSIMYVDLEDKKMTTQKKSVLFICLGK